MDLFEKCNNMERVEAAKKEGVYPYFSQLTSGQDTEVYIDGVKTVMIGSNNYLGLTNNSEVIAAAIEGVKNYGTGCSGSRFLNGNLDIHVKLEKELAEFLHKEAVVTFGTGFQSNLAIISAICGRTDYILCDRENHASIYDACRLSYAKMIRYKHSDMQDLEEQLSRLDLTHSGVLIVTDGVFSMSGEICKLPEIVKIAKKFGARIMVDDAHGLGVLGKHGRGTAEHFGLENEVDIYMGTFSKSLASLGGYMASDKKVVDFVRHNSRPFIFSASITPASVESARAALRILNDHPERVQALRDISAYMRTLLKERGVKIMEVDAATPIIPIYTYDDLKTFRACVRLQECGVYVNPVVSPAVPEGYSMIRTSYTATHTKAQMEYAADTIARVLKELDII